MKSGEIITYLGYAALIIIVIYFVTGILKISGEGLQNVLVGPLIEGMSANDTVEIPLRFIAVFEDWSIKQSKAQ